MEAPDACEPMSAMADEAGFRCRSASSNVEFTWRAFAWVSLERGHIVLLQHAGVANVLPVTAMQGATSPELAIAVISRWIRDDAAHSADAPSI